MAKALFYSDELCKPWASTLVYMRHPAMELSESTSTPQSGCAPHPSPSAPEKRRPSIPRPAFCEPVTDTKLFHSASLVQDAMFLAKFFSALKGAARLRLARRDVQAKVHYIGLAFTQMAY